MMMRKLKNFNMHIIDKVDIKVVKRGFELKMSLKQSQLYKLKLKIHV